MGKARAYGPLVVAAVLLVGCSSSSGSDGGKDTTTTTKKETTTTTVDPKEAAAKAYGPLLEDIDTAIEKESTARDGFAADNDLQGAIDSSKDLRNDLFDFDAAVRKLKVPDEAKAAVNRLLTEDGKYIEVLDGFVGITEIPDYNDQFDEEGTARDNWYGAADDLAKALGVDQVDFAPAGEESTTTTEPADQELSAGDTASTSTMSIAVPEGFTATVSGTIQMKDDNGSEIGLYNAYPDSGTTLDAVAKELADGTAAKNEWKIVNGPEKMKVGEYDAVGYSFAPDDTHTSVSIWFDALDGAGTRWHVITIDAADSDIDGVMNALSKVLDSVKVS
jgi:hypothetical protein